MNKISLSQYKTQCNICPNKCELQLNQLGKCLLWKNNGINELEFVGQNKITILSNEKIERKPIFHYKTNSKILSFGGYGCNMFCSFCANWKVSQEDCSNRSKIFSVYYLIKIAKEKKCQGIFMSYNEPTLYFPMIKALSENKGDLFLGIKTNAYINSEIWDDILNWVDVVNIDYKGSENQYKNICGVEDISVILDNIGSALIDKTVHTEISVPVYQDTQITDLNNLLFFKKYEDLPIHLLKILSAYKYKKTHTSDKKLEEIKNKLSDYFNYIYIHNRYKDGDLDTVCKNCKKTIIYRDKKNVKKDLCNCDLITV